jgi:hypothetical protein
LFFALLSLVISSSMNLTYACCCKGNLFKLLEF